ncbi:MAG TPA: HAMP domain-containing sensor histidine kinase, partial [Candidatus Dormibacteraeota bacterium]|nr:HAMP domain-containing sensor histidine kinase [Candidatus Dormibacteraeota bacterium]
AAGISEGDLSRRIGHQGPGDEVGRLAATFDGMLSRLESGFEQRRAFYALASHELRTPLTIARGHLEVLRRVGRPSPLEVHEAVDVALEELDRMTEEVDDMLLLGRMLLGRPGRLEDVDAGSVVRAVHARARGLAPRDWRIEVGGPIRVRADEEQLSRALLNLVTNAVRHTQDGDQVRLACRVSAGWARLEVADTGAGIPAADLPHVFAPWYRVGGHSGNVGGLGLVIVQEVARAHGGEVDVESREGAGSTFTIRVPLPAPEIGIRQAGLRDAG